jgi:predicted ATPase
VGTTRRAVAAATAAGPAFELSAFAALAPLARADDVVPAVARAVGAVPLDGETPHEALRRTLAGRRALLVADNFEHVLDAATDLAGLLRDCPGLTVLVTSREALGVAAERLHPLAPLAAPASDAVEPLDVAAAPATALLADRVRRHDPGFAVTTENAAALAAVARRLDGLPLAIELAAARLRLLSPAALAARLEHAVDTLGEGPRDADSRQRTLRATLDWSHDLLDADERAVFARFSALAGGATVELAEAVTGAGPDRLEALVAKHLLRRADGRLSMLHVVREYAAERLAAAPDAGTAAYAALLGACLELAEAAAAELDGPDGTVWFARLDTEAPNIAAALEWGIDHDPAVALELVAALTRWWRRGGRSQEGRRFIEAALAAGDAVASARARTVARVGFFHVSGAHVAAERKRELLEQAVALAPDADTRVLALTARVQLEVAQTAYAAAEPYARAAMEAAAGASDDARGRALVAAARTVATLPEALALLEEASQLFRRTGRLAALSELLGSVGWFALEEGDLATGEDLLGQAAELAAALPDKPSRAFVTGNRAVAALLAGRREEARSGFLAELRDGADARVDDLVGEALVGLAALAATDGRPRDAARLLGASERRRPAFTPDRVEQRILDDFLAERESAAWVRDRAAGRALDLDAAVSAGLAEA